MGNLNSADAPAAPLVPLAAPRSIWKLADAIAANVAAGQVHVPALPPLPCGDGIPALTVQLLDGFHVWVGLQAVSELPQGKAASLFKLLVLQRHRPLPRAHLGQLYWPEADAAGARNNLNVTLHRLRRLLRTAARIIFHDESYQLQADGEIWLDAEQFERLAEQGRHEERHARLDTAVEVYEAAAQLYQSDLMPEIGVDAALSPLAQALRDRLSQVLTRAATLREDLGDAHGCLRMALRCLALDQCNEAAHRQLMRCYACLQQPLEVERQYRRCVSALRLQLGLGPSVETTAQYRRLAERDAA